ncbi:MAG: RidA family protein [Burkholderiaceae bacterium]|nr:RidA family protein [Burkholderiaceae bacterium]
MSIQRIQSNARMSAAVVANGFIFLSGQVADDTNANVAGQTEQILAKIDSILAEAGASKEDIVSANIWIADAATFNEMNSVWDAWVPQGHTPARACVESKLAFPQYTVEIGVTAVVKA